MRSGVKVGFRGTRRGSRRAGPRRRERGRRKGVVRAPQRVFCVALACLSGLAVSACGGEDRVVARVGRVAIHARAVEHWGAVLSVGGIVNGPLPAAGHTRKQRALAFLISARAIVEQAAEQGVPVSASAVRDRVEELRQAVPGGDAAFDESLKGARETVADVELEIEAELARAAVRRAVTERAGAVSPEQVRRYYRQHQSRYRLIERRKIDIVEHLSSPAAARALARRAGTGVRLARRAYHELLKRPHGFAAGSKGAVERAIFAARAGVLSGPMPLSNGYALFVVRRIFPAAVRPFSSVRTEIEGLLAARARARARAAFAERYRSRWRARTSCSSGYVIAGCVQYEGSEAPAGPFGEG
jgi:hypothetical protein